MDLKRKNICAGRELCFLLFVLLFVCAGLFLSFYFTAGYGLYASKPFYLIFSCYTGGCAGRNAGGNVFIKSVCVSVCLCVCLFGL